MSKRKKRRKQKKFPQISAPAENVSAENISLSAENFSEDNQPNLPLESNDEVETGKNEIEKISLVENNENLPTRQANNPISAHLNYKKILKISLISILSLIIIWMLLPPLIANTPLVTAPIEKDLAKKFDANVDVQKIEISNWTLSPKIKIYSIDFYEKNTNVFLAYVDNINFRLNPFYLLIGKVKTKKSKSAESMLNYRH